MTNYLRRTLALLLLAAAVGCESDPTNAEEALQLRIVNDLADPIQVRLEPSTGSGVDVDFGVLQPGATSAYRAVDPSFFIYVDGNQFPHPGTEWAFGISNPPSPRWTLRIQQNGGWDQYAESE